MVTIIDSGINNLNYKDTWEDTKDTKVTQWLNVNNIDQLRDINNTQLKDFRDLKLNLISKEEHMDNNINLSKLRFNNLNLRHNKIMMMILISRLFKVLLFNLKIYPNSEKHDLDEYSIS